MNGLRLGIVGLASSHVPQWLRYVTQPNMGNEHAVLRACSITALGLVDTAYGDPVDRARVDTLQRGLRSSPLVSAGTPSLVASDMAPKVDAVIIADRHHGSHVEHALPFIRLGIPLFIDKPLASTSDEVNELLAKASSESAVQSYSAMRCNPIVVDVAKKRSGTPSHITVTGGADPQSPYGGAAFYGVHSIEMGLATAPGEVVSWTLREDSTPSVAAFRVISNEGDIQHVTDIDVELSLRRQHEPFMITTGNESVEIPVAGDYLLPSFLRWLNTLTGKVAPLSAREMALTVELTQILP